ncbi:WXG100 family type VII secretion target [Nocardioides aurantiacus]|uniref:ESAT-6-like protein n=1 Tax=Nocardioides aurantiacus TaxID=86796 RepID=A0A3N2CU67_9ACTN|nr:WXG100 family type VII secretion target [Nocardioides aurantiacus]ROR91041.1 WXG100 family type VII secretion target [Nocardioides aurantiacus]
MQQFNLTYAALDKAKADVDAAADRLQTDRTNIGRRVSGFLAGGWSGVAANAFVDGWDEWKNAAGEVLTGLRSMRELLEATQRDYVAADDSSQQHLNTVSAKLIDRLG